METRREGNVSNRPLANVFVVDDDPIIASTVTAILDINGYAVMRFTDPAEALIAAQFDIPDLLVSDITMPGISGIDLGIRMTARHPNCKVLLLSGHVNAPHLVEEAHAQGYHFPLLMKPVPPSELLARILTECMKTQVQPKARTPHAIHLSAS